MSVHIICKTRSMIQNETETELIIDGGFSINGYDCIINELGNLTIDGFDFNCIRDLVLDMSKN